MFQRMVIFALWLIAEPFRFSSHMTIMVSDETILIDCRRDVMISGGHNISRVQHDNITEASPTISKIWELNLSQADPYCIKNYPNIVNGISSVLRGCGYLYMVGIVMGPLVFLLLVSFLRPRRNNGMSFYMGIWYGFTSWYHLGNDINGQSLFKWLKDWSMVILLRSVPSMFYLATQIYVGQKIILTSLMAFLNRYW